ncbi:hypothetical protein PL659_21970, partial [Phocaeicola vulgatus]|nr:hypothetical protein [Phocaeicola vulgatus]
PICNAPVGLGAKRTLTFLSAIICVSIGEKAKAIVHCDVENKVHTMKKVICHLQEVGRNRT